ncbi:MAG TPA: tRNA preQ1(34) S-adenosylmethionine ribosyltransferase-isomerase QueA [Alphaproteobacteria bacterium]|nr:tRNA preQ1(34) S-adenosylmethionine ribosyltransferase-isomerase QueA [Alphaproteobacteria bacterium]
MPDTCFLTSDFDFDLPPGLIAQAPTAPRDHARLLHVRADALSDHHVFDLPGLLREGDLFVVNDTRVIPARLYGRRGDVRVEILLHKKESPRTWLAFAKPGKRLRAGDDILFAPDFAATVIEKRDDGEVLLRFAAADAALPALLEKYGHAPLPPYIRREAGATAEDKARYQTVYAAHDGAVAAPTAGLHFTQELLAKLDAKGIERATVTLHVGAGTFLPVKAERVKDHVMHGEWGEITPAVAARINKAKSEGRRVVAVGTTSLRLLEAAADADGVLRPFCGETDIFITPGYRFRIVDALVTNFHLPRSTLFMLVSAFSGMERMRAAYEYAIGRGYRFYSYGDASLLEKE